MNKKGQTKQDFEGILAIIFLVLMFIFFAPSLILLSTGNFESALSNLIEIFVPLVFVVLMMDVLRRFFTW